MWWVADVGAHDSSNGDHAITLVPVHGGFWRPQLEICLHQQSFYGGNTCWNDVLVARRDNRCLKRALLRNITGTEQRFGVACAHELASGCL